MENEQIKHIAFIMDGNGRWAKKRLLPRSLGHREGVKTMEAIAEAVFKEGINQASFFAFSTENWNRPKKEVDYLIRLLKDNLPMISKKMLKNNVKLHFCGDISVFDDDLKEIISDSIKETSKLDTKKMVNICLNYGGRGEIINAVNIAVKRGKPVTESEFSSLLYTRDFDDLDLLIRTGGEKRISNFMLYQSAYTELYFSDKLWPDFSKEDLSLAIDDFKKRNRRFGKIQ